MRLKTFIFKNLLQKNNDIRLSAQGILDYLKNKCQLYGASGDPVTAWLDFATALNIFIGPLTLNVVEKMHQNTHSSMIELGSKKLRQIYKTKLNERKKGHDEEPQNCDRSYQPGEKDASKRSTFEKLEHLLAQIVP